uniref:Uncharacterized protein n=1 Tax=Arundo donax TaxID=35708 RepID=A0A0A9GNM8_ARUDO
MDVSTSLSLSAQPCSSPASSACWKKFFASAQVSPNRICPMLAVIMKGRITRRNNM